jgi:hypothetical protein
MIPRRDNDFAHAKKLQVVWRGREMRKSRRDHSPGESMAVHISKLAFAGSERLR